MTVYDPPHRYATRGRIMPGTILDTEYEIVAEDSGAVLRMSKVAVTERSGGGAVTVPCGAHPWSSHLG